MFAGLQGWHLLIILVILSPVIIAAIGIPLVPPAEVRFA